MRTRNSVILLLLVALVLGACAPAQPATEAPTEEPAMEATEAVAEQPTEATEAVPEETEAPTDVPEEPIHIVTNQSSYSSYAPLFIADAEGYFAEQNIEIEWVPLNRAIEGLPLLATGDLDVLSSTVNAGLLNVLGQSDDIKVVADRGFLDPNGCTYTAVLVRSDLLDSGEVSGPEDLAGRTIIGRTTGASGYVLSTYLASGGLTMDDIELTDLPTSGYVDALSNGAVDGAATTELALSQIVNSGAGEVLAAGQDIVPGTQLSALVFGKRLLRDDPEAGVRFLTAYLKGARQYAEGKTPRNLEIMAEYTGMTTDELETSCWPPINPDGYIDFPATNAYQNWAVQSGELDQTVTEDQFWDPSVLEQALARLDQ